MLKRQIYSIIISNMFILKQQNIKKITTVLAVFVLVAMISIFLVVKPAAAAERSILFPVLGGGKYVNDFNSSRSGGPHHATDIMAPKLTPLVAAVDGTITYVGYPQPTWGYMVQITDVNGYEYNYLHINNDNPGTDDGNGGAMHAYAADIRKGNPVIKGQLIGWVGDSGNAESTAPHLHFEIYRPDGSAVDPYTVLIEAPVKRDLNKYDYPEVASETLPYGRYDPELNVAIGNFDNDTAQEVVTSPGKGSGANVKIYEKNMTFTGNSFFAYDDSFRGGADVAAGDIDGDGIDEIITGAGPGGGPHVKIFKANGQLISGFYAYDPKFSGGVSVAAGDIDGDGIDEIITGPGIGGGPHVKVFKANGQEVIGFFAYNPNFYGGVDVAAGDVTGDSKAEIITGAGPGGGPHVQIISYTSPSSVTVVNGFFAYESQFTSGVRVSTGNVRSNVNGTKQEILTAPRAGGGPNIRMFDGNTNAITSKMYLEEWWIGSYDIAAGEGFSLVSTGVNRRASIRAAF
jgi:hypothetical protein